MKTYELTYIISSSASTEESDTLKKEVESFLQEKSSIIIKSEKSAPKSLAYPIRRMHSGYVVITEFQAPETVSKEITDKLNKHVNVLRHALVIKRPVKQGKEKRVRRPMNAGQGKEAQEAKKVNMESIEKNLDQMLSE